MHYEKMLRTVRRALAASLALMLAVSVVGCSGSGSVKNETAVNSGSAADTDSAADTGSTADAGSINNETAGSGAESQDASDGGSSSKSSGVNSDFMSRLQSGNEVSDAYVDPAEVEEMRAAMIKATGYEYDYDNLTYELVWSDEFDYEGKPDESKWKYDTGGSGWGNAELQYYTAGDNAEVHDGVLTITARKEELNGCDYTSTRLLSTGEGNWTYGKFVIRAKMPEGRGTWPAIWMLPTDWKYGDWPASGEIDIMEHVGYDQDVVHASIHTKSYYHSIGTQKTATIRTEGVSSDFHTYTLEWLPDRIIIYIDDVKYFTYCPTDYVSAPGYEEWPFDVDFHLILNIAVGGGWGGLRGIDDDIWPQTMEVDYVRVYQSPEITAAVADRNLN